MSTFTIDTENKIAVHAGAPAGGGRERVRQRKGSQTIKGSSAAPGKPYISDFA